MLDAGSTGNVDFLLAHDDIEPLDDVEVVLDHVLDAHPELDAVAGDWDLLRGIEEHVSVMYVDLAPPAKLRQPPEPSFYPCRKF